MAFNDEERREGDGGRGGEETGWGRGRGFGGEGGVAKGAHRDQCRHQNRLIWMSYQGFADTEHQRLLLGCQ